MSQSLDCAQCSLEAGEGLLHTTPRSDIWFLLEHDAVYGAGALPESALPAEVKGFLQQHLKSLPNARAQLIKQGRADSAERPRFYVALTRPDQAHKLYRFQAPLAELLALDIPAIVAGDPRYDAALTDEQMVLVCTNGKKDVACATYGMPLYKALKDINGASVWQSSHIGGHRFAGTVAHLPSGAYYGRIHPEHAAAWWTIVGTGAVDDAHYRGNCSLDNPSQAAEIHLRAALGVTAWDGLGFVSQTPDGDGAWIITFTRNGNAQTVRVTRAPSAFQTIESTGDAPKHVPQFTVHG